jgi:hypothetical protein
VLAYGRDRLPRARCSDDSDLRSLPAHASPAKASISQIAYINLVFFRIAIIFYTTTCEEVEKRGVKKRAGRLEEEGRGEKSEGRQEEETR